MLKFKFHIEQHFTTLNESQKCEGQSGLEHLET